MSDPIAYEEQIDEQGLHGKDHTYEYDEAFDGMEKMRKKYPGLR